MNSVSTRNLVVYQGLLQFALRKMWDVKKLLMLTILAACGIANADVGALTPWRLAGTWQMVVPIETADLVRKMGLQEPKATLSLAADKSFKYTAVSGGQKLHQSGKFELKSGAIWLYGDKDAWTRVANYSNEGLDIDGLKFVKDISIELPGKWILTRGGSLDLSVNVTFTKDGNFSFQCSNATSKGKYLIEGNTLTFTWTEVDGDKVELGSMRKTITFEDDGAFKVDQFRYIKS